MQATQHEVTVRVPPSDRAKSIETLRQEGAPPEVIAWRERMETPEARTSPPNMPGEYDKNETRRQG